MDSTFKPFDFHRIFFGEAPGLFLLEIVFRTLIMYSYTVLLLRFLGKRGMGQLSMLELAIIISFGSAVGDPMVGAEMPIVHGMLAITVIALFQVFLERLIKMNRKVEAVMEGSPNLVVNEGVIMWECMKRDNISKEDLFRALRGKDVQHLGEVHKAFFETSGTISVFFRSPKKVLPGLAVLPDELIQQDEIIKEGESFPYEGTYSCMDCRQLVQGEKHTPATTCPVCSGKRWVEATHHHSY